MEPCLRSRCAPLCGAACKPQYIAIETSLLRRCWCGGSCTRHESGAAQFRVTMWRRWQVKLIHFVGTVGVYFLGLNLYEFNKRKNGVTNIDKAVRGRALLFGEGSRECREGRRHPVAVTSLRCGGVSGCAARRHHATCASMLWRHTRQCV